MPVGGTVLPPVVVTETRPAHGRAATAPALLDRTSRYAPGRTQRPLGSLRSHTASSLVEADPV